MHDAFTNITSAIEWRVLLVLALLSGAGVAILAAVDAPSGPTSIALGGMGAAVAFAVLRMGTADQEADAITGEQDLHDELEHLATQYRDESRAALHFYLDAQADLHRAQPRLGGSFPPARLRG